MQSTVFMVCFIALRARPVKRGLASASENPVVPACYRGDWPSVPSMREGAHQTGEPPAERRNRTMNTGNRPAINLVTRYNPIGIRAVVAAALQTKVRQISAK
jgi:hypothetical protein